MKIAGLRRGDEVSVERDEESGMLTRAQTLTQRPPSVQLRYNYEVADL